MREEKDSLGSKQVPSEAYYGVQTQRAIENFPISGLRAKPAFVDATCTIKKAAARVHRELGLLPKDKADAIIQAAEEILGGELRDQFVVDVYQAGAGTSHNMNTNEVLANRAIEILGGEKGDYSLVHPNDYVNMAQSTNDVIPTAIRLASLLELKALFQSVDHLVQSFTAKAEEFDTVIKSARTHLQDGVPMRLGQEVRAWASNLGKHNTSLERASEALLELGIGGTAAGTGLNAHPDYREMMVRELTDQTGLPFLPADDYFEAMQSMRPIVELSGALRNLAQDLGRIASDIRILASGPKTGLAELELPARQPGSSIMPGKVNPVMAEMVNMVAFQVMGCDTTVVQAAQAGQLELNVMMPVIAFNILHSIEILTNGIAAFDNYLVQGMAANEDRCRAYAEGSMSIVTALNPHIGYEKAAELAKTYLRTGTSIKELLKQKEILSQQEIENIFELRGLTDY